MAVQLTPALEHELQKLAEECACTVDQLAQGALESYTAYLAQLTRDVQEGEASAERDGWLTTEEVFERLNRKLLKTA